VPLISARLLTAPSVERVSGGVASVDLEFSSEAAWMSLLYDASESYPHEESLGGGIGPVPPWPPART
jgi:hypothetical protein